MDPKDHPREVADVPIDLPEVGPGDYYAVRRDGCLVGIDRDPGRLSDFFPQDRYEVHHQPERR